MSNRREQLEEARDHLLTALEIVIGVFGKDKGVRAYWIGHLQELIEKTNRYNTDIDDLIKKADAMPDEEDESNE